MVKQGRQVFQAQIAGGNSAMSSETVARPAGWLDFGDAVVLGRGGELSTVAEAIG